MPSQLAPVPSLVEEIFDGFPAAAVIVDEDVRLLMVNRAARDLLGCGTEARPVLFKRGGEALRCIHSFGPGGCGADAHCQDCVIRSSVGKAFGGGGVQRSRVFLQTRRAGGVVAETYVLVSAAPIHHGGKVYAVLTLEDISDLIHAKSMLPICASCRRIRNDASYWQTVEEYFKANHDVDFSHGLCEECAERLYPEDPVH